MTEINTSEYSNRIIENDHFQATYLSIKVEYATCTFLFEDE